MAKPHVITPIFEVSLSERRPYDLLDQAVLKARQEIQAAEDERIFEAMDDASRRCMNSGHSGNGGYTRDCDHPDCIARTVHES